MTEPISEAIKLYGTDEAVEPMQRLSAGPLTCEFDGGALRFIKVYGTEAIRNIAFVVRDKDWGTHDPALSNINVDQQDSTFCVTFDAACKDGQQEIRYSVVITGASDGTITFKADYTAITDFLTNRTGFVVLHPINGVSGHPVTVETVDGSISASVFPELVDPVQPFKNIRALTHDVLPGVSLTCRMEGDTFEMEDHRQWNDASYKTYVRPIALPWPYTIPRSTSQQQSVTLTISEKTDKRHAIAQVRDSGRCLITVGEDDASRPMPQIGIGLEPQHLQAALAARDLLMQLAPQRLLLWHKLGEHSADQLRQAAMLGQAMNVCMELQAVIPDQDFISEIGTLATQCRAAGLFPAAIHVAPAMYLRSITPGASWPEVTDLAEIYDELRKQFPGVEVVGGMLAFFPELNRHRPPTAHLDCISHASNTITHAADDITVTENLEALPYIIKTCRAFANNKPYHVGPSAIGMRFNPYGSRTMDNPANSRIAMARMDPRQRGLLNAAWTTGYIAHMARGDVRCVSLHAPTGEFGILSVPEAWPRPGFDNTARVVYPVYPVLAGMAMAAGRPQRPVVSSMSREVEALAYIDPTGKTHIWIANLTRDCQTVEVAGVNTSHAETRVLSTDTFDQCTYSTEGFEETAMNTTGPIFDLGPYCVKKITV